MHRLVILHCVWLTCWCPIKWAVGAPRRKKDGDESKVQMPHHSFAVPLDFNEVLNDWSISGASLVERERLLLHPSVPERAAFAWSKMPLHTNNFEVTVHFRVVGTKDSSSLVPDQSFAFWYVYENVSNVYNETKLIKARLWKEGMQDEGMTLSGAKANFNGFGAILSMTDGSAKSRPVVSGLWNDGSKELKYGEDVPTSGAKGVDFRNTLNPAQLKIRVTPTSIEGHLKQSPSLSWNECFKLDRSSDPVKTGGYIGFSAWSGRASDTLMPDLVSIAQLEVYNYDETSIGEEMDVSKEIQEAYRQMLTDDSRHFVDQKSQTEHLSRLIKLLEQHSESAQPADAQMFQDLQGLHDRMGRLGDDCKTLTKEVQVLVGTRGTSGETLDTMKNEIVGLRRILIKDSATHRQKLDAVHKNIAEVKQKHADASNPAALKEVVKQSGELEEHVQTRSNVMTGMMAVIIVAVIVIGVLMRNKMNYYEKKHFV
mmetsp:Transcript_132985/g.231160  ORF Transcript_132985/g.231160 Transcript_132985/m.231160 type:complete len:483 (+) Transcript_132985:144-1592(+)